MSFLVAAVILVGLLCVLDLLLTFGVIRRLRWHTELLSARGTVDLAPALAVGAVAGAFEATTVDGEQVSRELLTGRTLVGFFTPGCQPCQEQLPDFLAGAAGLPGGREQALAVVVDGTDQAANYVQRLAPVARVVVEMPDGPVCTAFAVRAFPAFFVVDGRGRIVGRDLDLGSSRAPSRV